MPSLKLGTRMPLKANTASYPTIPILGRRAQGRSERGTRVASFSGNVTISAKTDADMIKIYEFNEKQGESFSFQLSTAGPGGRVRSPSVHLE